VQVDLLATEGQCPPARPESDRMHAEDVRVEGDRPVCVGDGEHEVVQPGDPGYRIGAHAVGRFRGVRPGRVIVDHITSYSRDVIVKATPTDEVPAEDLAFNFRSGRLCLAFVATVGERWRGNIERLREPADLARWYTEVELLEEHVAVTQAGLRAARDLREAVHRGAHRAIGGGTPSAADERLINAMAGVPPLIPTMRSGRSRLVPPAHDAERAALSTVARDAIDLLSSRDAGRIRECASPECALLFVDTSRPGRRRWCSSTACGGASRSASYRRRRAGREGQTVITRETGRPEPGMAAAAGTAPAPSTGRRKGPTR